MRRTLEDIYGKEKTSPTDGKHEQFGFTAHIRARGEEARALKRQAGFRARRGVVERAHRWMNRFRRVLIRWDKQVENYVAFLHFACALLACSASGLFG
jgi:hypothetical protein